MSENVVPRYQVEHLDGKVKKLVYKYTKDKDNPKILHLTKEEELVDAGYMVYCPNGHSVHIETEEQLKALGCHLNPGKVDMESGETVVPDQEEEDLSPKALVMKSVRSRPSLKNFAPEE